MKEVSLYASVPSAPETISSRDTQGEYPALPRATPGAGGLWLWFRPYSHISGFEGCGRKGPEFGGTRIRQESADMPGFVRRRVPSVLVGKPDLVGKPETFGGGKPIGSKHPCSLCSEPRIITRLDQAEVVRPCPCPEQSMTGIKSYR